MILQLLIVAAALALPQCSCVQLQSDGQCPAGWFNRQGSTWCYQMQYGGGLTKSWDDATAACAAQNGYLLSVGDSDEKKWIIEKLRDYWANDQNWWIGNSRNADGSSEWRWSDGNTAEAMPRGESIMGLLTWVPGYSNRSPGKCLQIQQQSKDDNTHIRVLPNQCTKRLKYICKKQKFETGGCDGAAGWQLHHDKCYKLFREEDDFKENWRSARAKCESAEADLATANSQDDNRIVKDIVNGEEGKATKVWIGLKTYKSSSVAAGYEWKWTDGSGLTYESWEKGSKPDISKGQEDNVCVQTVGNDANRLWRYYACDGGQLGYLCSKAAGVCASGWTQHRDLCYSFRTVMVSWDEADATCRGLGGSLAQFKQKHVQEFVKKYKDDFVNSGSSYIWIDIYKSKSDTDKELKWSTGAKVTSGYSNWNDNQPKLIDGKDNAARIIAGSDIGRWEMAETVSKGGFVCQLPVGKPPADQTTTPDVRFTCPTGWRIFRRSCYRMDLRFVDWLRAESNCKETYPGAALVDIRDKGEQEFLQGFITPGKDYWIGLHARDGTDRTFRWSVDNSKMTYENWEKGEPSNSEGIENCVEMYQTGRWNDKICDYKLASVCKKPADFNGSPQTNPSVGPTTPQVWDPLCGPFWTRDPLTGLCYMFIEQALIWLDAKHQCEFNGGKLLSVLSDSEKTYVAGRIQGVAANNPSVTAFWIGLNDRAADNSWVWDDRSPVVYINWERNAPTPKTKPEPLDQEIKNCVVINAKSLNWIDSNCANRYSAVCRKAGQGYSTFKPPVTTIPVPPGYQRGCKDGYTSYNYMCYRMHHVWKNWQDARAQCQSEGGDLASIMNIEENQFIRELAANTPEIKYYAFWVGMYDSIASHRTMSFKWSDGSEPVFTNWSPSEPNNYNLEDCVEVVGVDEGRWNDNQCSKLAPYACKQRQVPVQVTPPTTRPYGCPSEFDESFDRHCLKFVVSGQSLRPMQAKAACEAIGGTLATIPNENVQKHFLLRFSQLGTKEPFFIGLTKQFFQLYWDDRRPVTYTKWRVSNRWTVGRGIVSNVDGFWEVVAPSAQLGNYVCQSPQQGITDAPTTYDPKNCANGWVEADNTCYRAFFEVLPQNRLSWSEARVRCKTLGGDLASIHSQEAMEALKQTLTGRQDYWIGLNSRGSDGRMVWSDGSAVQFLYWRDGKEPENVNGNQNCAMLPAADLFWRRDNCVAGKNWICETKKGTYPTGTEPPSTVAPDIPDCGDGWYYNNGYCYLFDGRRNSWHNAVSQCREHGGDLVSLHSNEESDFLLRVASKLHVATERYWIGLNELGHKDGFRWSDGTAFDFVNWQPGEPNDYDGPEHCVSFYSSTGLWNDDLCGHDYRSICKKSNSTSTAPPTTAMPGFCPAGYTTVGDKCYKLFAEPKLNWTEASKFCMSAVQGRRSYLASIGNGAEQAMLVSIKPKDDMPLWIGLFARTFGHKYFWSDNSVFSFTNWAHNEPSSALEKCGEMYTDEFRAGQWNDITCDKVRGFYCMTFKDERLNTAWPQPTEVSCPAGWTAYADACYYFGDDASSYQGAKAQCSGLGATLATVSDVYEQSYLHTHLNGISHHISAWIGLSAVGGTGEFEWHSGWPITFANWGPSQPAGSGDQSCVRMASDGRWFTEGCSVRHPYLCRISKGSRPSVPPLKPGVCPSADFAQFGSHCYYFANSTVRITAFEAMYKCRTIGDNANLVSIVSDAEQKFLALQLRQMHANADTRADYWIGMTRAGANGFEWQDKSLVSYTYWSQGEPSNGDRENCVELYHRNLKWNDHFCSKRNSFICKLPVKAAPVTQPIVTIGTRPPMTTTTLDRQMSTTSTTRTSTTRRSETTTKGKDTSTGTDDLRNDAIVVILIFLMLLLLIGLVVAVFLYRRMGGKAAGSSDDTVGFSNANWSRSSDSVKLDGGSGGGHVQLDTGLENPTYSA